MLRRRRPAARERTSEENPDVRRPTMQPTLDIRRHGDGSIDFDFYRRRAVRRRRLARRIMIRSTHMRKSIIWTAVLGSLAWMALVCAIGPTDAARVTCEQKAAACERR
jgi:hypothetical protein